MARSGSNLLSDGLRETGRAGKPNQFFLPAFEAFFRNEHRLSDDVAFADYVQAMIRGTSTSNEVFGFKLMGWYLHEFLARLRAAAAFSGDNDLSLLRSAFPRVEFIRISRRDKLRQAISKARATQTGLWKVQPGRNESGDARYDRELIECAMREAEDEERIWDEFFAKNSIQPLAVEYEELCRSYEATIAAVLNFLHIGTRRANITSPVTKKQSDAVSAEWERRYRAGE